ncbi:MAG: hypothetical protein GY807_20455 [Gammaproteobacteria bacterium]|nr:hypothetical protein [Gammaproteobacteria bacterium]
MGLTPEEIEKLRLLVPYAEELALDAKYKRAVRVIWRHWRALVISFAATLGAMVLLYDRLGEFFKWWFR